MRSRHLLGFLQTKLENPLDSLLLGLQLFSVSKMIKLPGQQSKRPQLSNTIKRVQPTCKTVQTHIQKNMGIIMLAHRNMYSMD